MFLPQVQLDTYTFQFLVRVSLFEKPRFHQHTSCPAFNTAVIIPGDRGNDFGWVSGLCQLISQDRSSAPQIIRLAQEVDILENRRLQEKAEKIFETLLRHKSGKGVSSPLKDVLGGVKPVGARIQFDNKKITIYCQAHAPFGRNFQQAMYELCERRRFWFELVNTY